MSVPELLGYSTHVVTKMTGNPHFSIPSPALVKITNATTLLQKAYDLAQGAGPAQTATMRQERRKLETLLTAMGHYVEDVANDTANANVGEAPIILSSGMETKAFTLRPRQTFSIVRGEMPGTIQVLAESVPRGSHEWQYTTDIAESTGWIDGEPTVQAHTTFTGLESGKRYFFRHRTVLPRGPSPWSDPQGVIVT